MAKRKKHVKPKTSIRGKKISSRSTNRKQNGHDAKKVQKSSNDKKKLQDDLYNLFLEEEKKRKRSVPKKISLADELYELIEKEEARLFYKESEPKRKRQAKKEVKEIIEAVERVNKEVPFTFPEAKEIAGRLRYKGKYISEEFEKVIRAAAGAARKDPQELLSDPANQKALDNILRKSKASAKKTANTIIELIKGRDDIWISDGDNIEQVSYVEATKRLISFDTRVKRDEVGVVYVGILVEQYLDGKIIIYLPRKRASDEELEEFLNDYTEYFIYEGK